MMSVMEILQQRVLQGRVATGVCAASRFASSSQRQRAQRQAPAQPFRNTKVQRNAQRIALTTITVGTDSQIDRLSEVAFCQGKPEHFECNGDFSPNDSKQS